MYYVREYTPTCRFLKILQLECINLHYTVLKHRLISMSYFLYIKYHFNPGKYSLNA